MEENSSLLLQLLLQVFLIILNAVFACAEIAIITINDNKLEKMSEQGNKKAKRLINLTNQPAKFLATIQVGITLAGFLGSAFAADNFSDRLVHLLIDLGVNIPVKTLDAISVILITLILSYFTLIFGELVPKRIAMKKAESIALAMSGFISFISSAFAPIVWFLTISTNTLLKLIGINPDAEDEEVTEEEIRMMVDVGSEKGTIDIEEKKLIHNIFEFDDKSADVLMTHRRDIVMLWLGDDVEKWEKTIYENHHSIYPICADNPDDIIGLLNSKLYFRLIDKSKENILDKAVQPAYFVPESISADILFKNMKKERNYFAVVVDEYGGTSGVITIGDLVEELLGDINDDFNSISTPPLIEKINEDTWSINGTTPLYKVADTLKVILPVDDYNTFSGMVFALLGSIPPDGSNPEIKAYGLSIQINEVKEHRLIRAYVKLDTKS